MTQRVEQHYASPVYKQAREDWLLVQAGQIRKGFEKYPEPLNPTSWTADELIEHAVQENVDQMHYLTALKIKVQEMEKDIVYLFGLIRNDTEIGRRLMEEELKEDRPLRDRLEHLRQRYRL